MDAISVPMPSAHVDAHTPPTVEIERAMSAKSAARTRNRSFMSTNLIAHQSKCNPLGIPKVCNNLHPQGLGRFYASRNAAPLLPYHGTELN